MLFDKETFELVDIQMRANGTWNDIFHFITLLENIPKHHVIERVSFERQISRSEEDLEPVWSAIVRMKILKLTEL